MPEESNVWEPFHIPAMDCPTEFRLIDQGLRSEPGIVDIQANYLERTVRVQFDASRIEVATIRQRLRQIGFPAQDLADSSTNQPAAAWNWQSRCVATGGVLLLMAAFGHLLGWSVTVYVPMLVMSACIAGAPVALAAWRSLKLRRLDMNSLMIIAATGALAIGEWYEAATAMTLFGVAHWLESLSLRRAGRAIAELADRLPQMAHLISKAPTDCGHQHEDHEHSDGAACSHGPSDDHSHSHSHSQSAPGEASDVPVATLAVGDVVLVRPGESIPIDGEVIDGRSTVTEAELTGESVPVTKTVGDAVLAGTVNGEAALQVMTQATASDSAVSQVGRLVQEASAQRSRAERFVDRFARYYTPVVIGLALLVALGVPLVLSGASAATWTALFPEWLHRGLVLLVIACPCALVISTPITMVCGLQRAARAGLLVKGADSLEVAAEIDTLAFDKTGTLTRGHFQVSSIATATGVSESELLGLAAAVESQSAHPIARAMVAAAAEEEWPDVSEVVAVPGRGISARWHGQSVRLGTWEFVMESLEAKSTAAGDALRDATNANATCFYVASDRLLGRIELSDGVRPDAASALADLRTAGMVQSVMLTGDRREVAQQVAAELQIERFHASLLPADKVELVTALRGEAGTVAMVGDGFNDAPALAAADLGIAMGSGASGLALESADVVVLSPQLGSLTRLFRIAKLTRARLWQNIGLALTIKAVVLLITAAGYGTMWLAVAADVGASLLVIFNGMRLLTAPLEHEK